MIELALLMGGHGRRLGGADKTRLVLPSGESTAEALLRVFGPLTSRAFLVGRADQAAHPLVGLLALVADERPDEGPLGGIAAALGAARAPWVFVLACDLVGLEPADLGELAAARSRGVLAIAWRGEPLCALYHRALKGTADHVLATGERRATALLRGARLLERTRALGNLNTDEDLTKARATRARP